MTRFQFDDDNYPFVGSDIDITLKTEYLRHKTSKLKVGTSIIYWCKYSKRVGYGCTVKVKTLRIDKKVLYMEELDGKELPGFTTTDSPHLPVKAQLSEPGGEGISLAVFSQGLRIEGG